MVPPNNVQQMVFKISICVYSDSKIQQKSFRNNYFFSPLSWPKHMNPEEHNYNYDLESQETDVLDMKISQNVRI